MGQWKKPRCTAITVATQENAIKRLLLKGLQYLLDFDFFKHPVYPYWLKEDLIVRLDLNSSEKVILCSRNTAARCKLSDISLEYETVFDESYAVTIGELYTRTKSIPDTRIEIHYQTLSKKTMLGRLTLTTCLFVHFKVYCSHSLINVWLCERNEEFYNPAIKKVLILINDMHYQLLVADR